MKKVLMVLGGVLGIALGITTATFAQESGTITQPVKYNWGFSGSVMGTDQSERYIQVNGDIDFKIKKEWAKDWYIYAGMNIDKSTTLGIGYYFWYPRLGVQFGRMFSNKGDNTVISVFMTKNVLAYFGKILLQIGE